MTGREVPVIVDEHYLSKKINNAKFHWGFQIGKCYCLPDAAETIAVFQIHSTVAP